MGCGPAVDQDGSTADSSSSGAGPTTTTTQGTTGTPGTSSSTSTTSADDDSGAPESSSGSPIDLPLDDCSLFAQDCPPGFKCMPYSNDGGPEWNDTRCTLLAPDPQASGESCSTADPFGGVDDCELGSMCWDVDAETGTGYCIDFCRGSETEPSCEDGCERCAISDGTPLPLCVPLCDPLAQDCDGETACYAVNDGFACVPDASRGSGGIGEACEFLNSCGGGSFCADAALLPSCEGTGCCTPFCDAAAADACDAMLAGTVCVPWYDEGDRPSGCATETLGVCLLPQ
jgi:hypothetical protein